MRSARHYDHAMSDDRGWDTPYLLERAEVCGWCSCPITRPIPSCHLVSVHDAHDTSTKKQHPPFTDLLEALDVLLHHPEFILASIFIQILPHADILMDSWKYDVCSTLTVTTLEHDVVWKYVLSVQMNSGWCIHPIRSCYHLDVLYCGPFHCRQMYLLYWRPDEQCETRTSEGFLH